MKDRARLSSLTIPVLGEWCLVVKGGNPPYDAPFVTPKDMARQDVVISRQELEAGNIRKWCGAKTASWGLLQKFSSRIC